MIVRRILLGYLLLLSTAARAEEISPRVKIYLPRQKTVAGPVLTLDEIAVVTGEDAAVQRAKALPLGRAPFPGETIRLDRDTIRARLASAENLRDDEVALTGAAAVAVRRNVSRLEPAELVQIAETHLQSHLPAESLSWKLARKPEALCLPDDGSVKLQCRLDEQAPSGHVRVVLEAVADDKTLDTREVLFLLRYRAPQVTATADIRAGELVTPDNARLDMVEVARRPDSWDSPFGATARKMIQAGAVIRESMIRRTRAAATVRRNQTVRLKLTGPGWCITALGVALQNGQTDDIIAVRNLDSKKVIQARVDAVGDVIPLSPGR